MVPLTVPAVASAQNGTSAVCAAASRLLEEDLPARALALMAAAEVASPEEPEVCGAIKQTASSNLQTSFFMSQRALELLQAEKWAEAMSAAEAALEDDADNVSAQGSKEIAKSENDKKAKADQSQLQGLFVNWTTFNERHLSPFTALLVPFAASLSALLVAARGLVVLVGRWPVLERRSLGAERGKVLGLGIVETLASASLFSFGQTGNFVGQKWSLVVVSLFTLILALYTWRAYADSQEQLARLRASFITWCLLAIAVLSWLLGLAALAAPVDTPWWLVIPVALMAGSLGSFLTAWWLATRLRLEVSVDLGEEDEDKSANEGFVVAVLGELGVNKPRGLEVPRGADVTALEGALMTLPENTFVKIVKNFLSLLAGTTPWIATVEGRADWHSVSISRNGKVFETVVIEPLPLLTKALTLAGTDKERATSTAHLCMAAAAILVTLSREHPSIQSGLGGATQWRSVGLQYVATVVLRNEDAQDLKKAILAEALEVDPDNLAAALAFRHVLSRYSDEAEALVDYREWLARYERVLAENQLERSALRLRACYTRAVIAINAVFAEGKTSVIDRKRSAISALEDLKVLLNDLRDVKDFAHLLAVTRANTQGLEWLVDGPQPNDGALEAASPNGAYNEACFYASVNEWNRMGSEADHGDVAVKLLRRASADPELALWMLNDPSVGQNDTGAWATSVEGAHLSR
jgi:hypothetical protein